MTKLFFYLSLGVMTLAGCADQTLKYRVPVSKNWIFQIPSIDWQDEVTGECKDGYTCWSELSQKNIRRRLSNDANIELFKVNQDGSVAGPLGSASVSKGKYILSEYVVKLTTRDCDLTDPTKGSRLVGAGIQVTAEINVQKANVKVSGLLPLSAEAADNRVSGKLRIRSWGIDTNQTVVNLLNTSRAENLDDDGIKSAITALTVAEALLQDPKTELIPQTFAIVESYDGACSGKPSPTE